LFSCLAPLFAVPARKNGDPGFEGFLITSKASDARRRGATIEAYGAIRRKEESASGGKATPQMMP